MPPLPKPAALRQRRNRSSTSAVLTLEPAAARRRTPSLPKRAEQPWHPMTRAFWRDVWRSPMAPEYLEADVHGLYVLAELVDRYWQHPTPLLASEIRLQRQCFGLTPIDRRRLQWEVQRVEEGAARRNPPAPSRRRMRGDPRSVLQVVS